MTPDAATDDSLVSDLSELALHPLAYGQETHGELHDDCLSLVEEVRKLLDAVITLPAELRDPAYAPDGGALQAAYNRMWCWLNSPVEVARKL